MASLFGFQRQLPRPQLASPGPARGHSVFRTRWLRINQAPRPAAARWHRVLAAGDQPVDSRSSDSSPSPLQRCLAELGVAGWRDLAKVAELVREGVTAEDAERLFAQHIGPRACSLEDIFLPNLAYLRGLLAGAESKPKQGEPAGLTPLGRLLRRQPSMMAQVISRTPELVLELDRWVCGELGVARAELAAVVLKSLIVLRLSIDTGRSVVAFFEGELGLSQEEVVRLLLRHPIPFAHKPEALREKVRQLGDTLGVKQSRASQMMVSQPSLSTRTFIELPAVLSELDELCGREGAGAAIVMRAPIVATLSSAVVRRSLDGLLELGLGEGEVVGLVEADPTILTKKLGGDVQQQKLAWAAAELKWPLRKMFAGMLFCYSLPRMASRLAFRQQLGLPDPGSLALIGMAAEPKFLERLSRRVGREVGKAEFDAFVAEWLCTEQGRKYGFKPDTVPWGRKPNNARS